MVLARSDTDTKNGIIQPKSDFILRAAGAGPVFLFRTNHAAPRYKLTRVNIDVRSPHANLTHTRRHKMSPF